MNDVTHLSHYRLTLSLSGIIQQERVILQVYDFPLPLVLNWPMLFRKGFLINKLGRISNCL